MLHSFYGLRLCCFYSRSTLGIFMLYLISQRVSCHHFILDSPSRNAVMIKESTWASWTNTLNSTCTRNKEINERFSSTPDGMRGTKLGGTWKTTRGAEPGNTKQNIIFRDFDGRVPCNFVPNIISSSHPRFLCILLVF